MFSHSTLQSKCYLINAVNTERSKTQQRSSNYNFITRHQTGIRQLERNEYILTSGFDVNG